MRRSDVYRTVSQGGGGYGDPLDRDPHRVADDVTNGLVSVEWAQRAYGVVFDAKGTVDAGETKKARDAIRQERRRAAGQAAESVPSVKPWIPSSDAVRVSEAVYCEPSDSKLQLRCRCGCVLGPANKSPKMYALMSRLPVQAIGPEVNPFSVNGARFELREFYCPACMTRLEVEISRPDDPVLDDSFVSPDWITQQHNSTAPAKRTKGDR